MAPRLILHSLPGEKRAGRLAELIEELYGAGRRVVVWVADEGRRQILDDFLWTFRKLSFVPHCLWRGGMEASDDPVVLVGEAGNPNGADVLVVGDDLPPTEWLEGFDEVHDLVPPGREGETRTQTWREKGLLVD